ncbi:uncharacterized protein LOC112576110 [Pomacea canaliculata]|uniref:uncharacterized protein LOC112576110 n=1 Tax=Pomacea canaliculata TaxID=400727 RepID=UPI000D72DC19|nr:uncharacterized protein LOC112576110 [Pomacea canaliculata]
MAGQPLSTVQKDNHGHLSDSGGPTSGGGRVKGYVQVITDRQASYLTGNNLPLLELKKKSGAEVDFDKNLSPVPGMKILIIRGNPHQIEKAINLMNAACGIEETMLAQAQEFWLRWVEAAFPELDSRAYFLPPVYFNRVPMTRQTVSGQDVLVLQSAPGQPNQSNQISTTQTSNFNPHVQESDIRAYEAFQHVLFCLQKKFEDSKEVFVGLSQLRFGQYLDKPCYAAAVDNLPLSKTLPKSSSKDRQGAFSLLLIHRYYGFVVCEVKSLGKNYSKSNMTDLQLKDCIRNKLKHDISQLDKAEKMLSHLVSDIAPEVRITKTIVVPNITAVQVQQAISDDSELTQDLCRCLGTTENADIPGLCLCSDQLSDPKTPCDVSSHVLRELGHWWQRRVAGAGPDPHMTDDIYKILLARFCGPATTVTIPCTSAPRLCLKTLGQAASFTGQCYTAVITLFPEQVHLLHTAPPTLFVTGPPGTGKTVVLLLMAIQWLQCGHHVHILSTWWISRAVCMILYHKLLQAVRMERIPGVSPEKVHLHEHDILLEKNMMKAVTDLSQCAKEESLYVIADEVGPESRSGDFGTFCEELMKQVRRLSIWAGSCYHNQAPDGWQVEYLRRPLRSPPTVVREVDKTWDGIVSTYGERGVRDHTDGPPVKRLYHKGQGHISEHPGDCMECGREVARFLRSLRVDEPGSHTEIVYNTETRKVTTPPALEWRDMMVMYYWMHYTGVIEGLQEAGIPVRVMKDDDIEDVATASSDVVWVAPVGRVRGLERKVVVSLDPDINTVRLHLVSRCTSQLIIVLKDEQ